MEKTYYKVGQEVYHWHLGAGIVTKVLKAGRYPITVKFENRIEDITFTEDGRYKDTDKLPSLSHTPYNFVTGGFTRSELLPEIEIDTLVYVKSTIDGSWMMRYFAGWSKENWLFAYDNQKKTSDAFSKSKYQYWSLTNPLL